MAWQHGVTQQRNMLLAWNGVQFQRHQRWKMTEYFEDKDFKLLGNKVNVLYLGGGFKCFHVHPYLGEDSHFDQYFSNGLKLPTRYGESDNMDTGIIVLRFVFHRSHSYVFLLFVLFLIYLFGRLCEWISYIAYIYIHIYIYISCCVSDLLSRPVHHHPTSAARWVSQPTLVATTWKGWHWRRCLLRRCEMDLQDWEWETTLGRLTRII